MAGPSIEAIEAVAALTSIPEPFRSFRIHNDEKGYRSGIESVSLDALSPGDVTVRVAWSGINYKDALAATGKGKILRRYPLNGGIDLAGTVVSSDDPSLAPGTAVVVNGSQPSAASSGLHSLAR